MWFSIGDLKLINAEKVIKISALIAQGEHIVMCQIEGEERGFILKKCYSPEHMRSEMAKIRAFLTNKTEGIYYFENSED